MKLSVRILSVFCISSLIGLTSCGDESKKSENALTEGIIEYKTTPLDANHPMSNYVPSEAVVKFKENKLFVEMEAGYGVLKTAFISNPDKKNMTQLVTVNLANIKSACVESEASVIKDNQDYQLKFEETKETKNIAGYICKKVKTSMVNDPSISFDTYYTPDLGADNTNDLNPYKGIKGMLMDYRLKKFGIEMRFLATKVKKDTISNHIFELPEGYKMVTRSAYDTVFTSLMDM